LLIFMLNNIALAFRSMRPCLRQGRAVSYTL
jgi:hypothetical protein